MGLGDLTKNLVSALRYLAAPVVAVLLVLAFDKDHNAAHRLIAAWHWESAPPFWLVIGLVAAVGIATYFAHRIILHFLLSRALNSMVALIVFRNSNPKQSIKDLDAARWQRRHSQQHSPAHSVQLELDQANAAVHFFYCTAWAFWLLVWLFKKAWPDTLTLTTPLWCVVIVLAVIGLFGDFQLTFFDIKAYNSKPSLKAPPAEPKG